MRIMQITDVHIGRALEDTHGVDVRANLDSVLQKAVKLSPDMIVLTGDLCFKEPHEDIYDYILGLLDHYNISPLVIAGNHDCSSMLAQKFGLEINSDSEVYYMRHWNGYNVLFLDSGRGGMSPNQYQWLESQLSVDEPVLIFMHHPPAVCGVPYMDNNHAFQEIERFQEVIRTSGKEVHLFCGHYHVEKDVDVDNLHIHITPSTFFQIRDDIEDFGVDHYRVGYRLIQLGDRSMTHSVNYLD